MNKLSKNFELDNKIENKRKTLRCTLYYVYIAAVFYKSNKIQFKCYVTMRLCLHNRLGLKKQMKYKS